MRKLFAIMLSVVLLMSMSVNAFAADSQISGEDATGQSTVYYQAPSTFSIVIPEMIYIMDGYTFTATEINISSNLKVFMRITNLDENNILTLTNTETGEPLNMEITGLDEKQRCAIFEPDNLTSTLTISGVVRNNGENPRAGEYTGIMEFVIGTGTG